MRAGLRRLRRGESGIGAEVGEARAGSAEKAWRLRCCGVCFALAVAAPHLTGLLHMRVLNLLS
ncbi:unnamed protein product [Symbiodinium necroappetens]|uniref:Uncharacterized protein n=1 Tax=Symbiodinium necroappetens TaxID=1628268 RepID=A0A812LUU1_9DINO|nr:unnamed protein product [Symbiodinium necroappetens]